MELDEWYGMGCNWCHFALSKYSILQTDTMRNLRDASFSLVCDIKWCHFRSSSPPETPKEYERKEKLHFSHSI